MKQSQTSKPAQQNSNGNSRVENKDNIDSRHSEENMVKKNHITHNEQEQHSDGKKQKQSQSQSSD